MGRAYTSVIPPEFQVMATQVTNKGEPSYAPLTRQNYGTIGRSAMGSNDMQDIGGEPEVYNDEMDPLAYASQQTAQMVAKLKRETALSQTGDITKLVDKTNVQYEDISRDDQVSNVKGMRFTGDPSTVGQAMRYHGDAQFSEGRILDGADIQASIDRAATGMDKASRSSLAQALAHLGPEALDSLPSSALAGLNDGIEIAGTNGFASLVVESTGFVNPRLPTQAHLKKRTVKKPLTPRAARAAMLAANKRAASLRSQGRGLPAPMKRGAPSATNREEQARAKRDMPYRAAQKAVQKETVPAAFVALAAQRQREAQQNARKPAATQHPSQSNYEDSQGQVNTVNAQKGAEAKRQMQMAMKQIQAQMQAAWGKMNPAQRKQAQAFVKRLGAQWAKMTPMQRQNAIKNFQQQLRQYMLANAKRTQAATPASRRATAGSGASVYEPKTASNGGDVESLQAAADAQNGNQAAQQEMTRKQFQAQEKAKLMAELTTAWNRATARMTPAQKQKLQAWFVQAQKQWLAMTPAQRRQALATFRNQVAMLAKATKLAKQGRGVTSEMTTPTSADTSAWSDPTPSTMTTQSMPAGGASTATPSGGGYADDPGYSNEYVDETGFTGGGAGLMGDDDGQYLDVTNESSGYLSKPPVSPWLIGGAVTVVAITGGMLFMSGKAK